MKRSPIIDKALDTLKLIFTVLRSLLRRDASLLAAGLAFFAMLSLAPFIVLAVAVAGAIFDQDTAQTELQAQIALEAGEEVANFVVGLAQNASDMKSLSIATVVGALLLFWSSTRLFMEVRRALHTMWQIPPPAELDWRGAILTYFKARLFAAIGTVIFGSLMLGMLGAKVVIEVLAKLSASFPIDFWMLLEPLFAIGLLAALIMIIYKLLPDEGPPGWAMWIGAFATAGLLVLGRTLVMKYVAVGAIGNAYGAAGSAVIFLIWAYWSALAFLFGARLAWALADRYAKPRTPAAVVAEAAD